MVLLPTCVTVREPTDVRDGVWSRRVRKGGPPTGRAEPQTHTPHTARVRRPCVGVAGRFAGCVRALGRSLCSGVNGWVGECQAETQGLHAHTLDSKPTVGEPLKRMTAALASMSAPQS